MALKSTEDKMTSPVSFRTSKIAFGLISLVGACAIVAGCAGAPSAVATATPTPTTTSPTPTTTPVAQPSVAYNPNTNFYYLADGFAGTVRVINGASNVVTDTIAIASASLDVFGITIDSTTNLIYVVSKLTGTMTVINGATNQISETVPSTVASPIAVAVNSTTNQVYVLGAAATNLNVFDGSSNALVTSIALPGPAFGLAVNSKTNMIFVTDEVTSGEYTDGSLTLIDGTTNTVAQTLSDLLHRLESQ